MFYIHIATVDHKYSPGSNRFTHSPPFATELSTYLYRAILNGHIVKGKAVKDQKHICELILDTTSNCIKYIITINNILHLYYIVSN